MTLPIHPVTLPAALRGQINGQLPTALLASDHFSDHPVTLEVTAYRSWAAMRARAAAVGVSLYPTSVNDTYRNYSAQVALFQDRYTRAHLAGQPSKEWGGVTYWLRPGVAEAAVPGTSNHGLGLAVDVANATGGRLAWLLANAWDYGWSWELQSEPWHIRYCTGDNIPQAVLAYEATENDVDFNTRQKIDAIYNTYPTIGLDTTTSPSDGTGHVQQFTVPLTKHLAQIEADLAEIKRLITKTTP